MKKLLLIVPMLHQGGFERACVTTARLMQQYYDVTILIFSDKGISYDVSGIKVVNINVPPTRRPWKFRKVINLFRRVRKVRSYKKKNDIDIAYSFGLSANYVNVLSKLGNKAKVLTGIHRQSDMDRIDQVALLCKKSDYILSCSKEIIRRLRRDYHYKRSSFIYNPLEVDMIREKADDREILLEAVDIYDGRPIVSRDNNSVSIKKDESYTIVASGRQDYTKGLWHLIKAFKLVYEEYPFTKLMIVGNGDFKPFKRLAGQLGVGERVIFPDIKKKTFAFVNSADLYVLSSNHESFPNTLLEAMALGKPCVATDCKTGPREILLNEEEYQKLIREKTDGSSADSIIYGEYGILVPNMDEHEDFNPFNITKEDEMLSQGIIAMMSDKDRMKKYGEKAYERAKGYAPEKYTEDLRKILEKV